ncbi:hypothetical protein BH09ACT1_BH09ACT1_08390 [soil metagenome]
MRAVDDFAASDAIATLVSASGGGRVGNRRGDELFAYLERFSAEHWDFRAGRERNLAADGRIDDGLAELVLDLAADLGLADNHRPTRTHYDTVVMTGGMVRAGIVKPRFVSQLLAQGTLTAEHVVFLGAFRPFGGDETGLALALEIPGADEFDAMTAGMQRAFRLDAPPEETGERSHIPTRSWAVRRWTGGIEYSVVAAPGVGHRRATTADTYRFWCDSIRRASERSVLLVTTPIYVPYQAAAAVEVLGLGAGIAVETVGISAAANDLGPLTQVFSAQHHLQELRSAIRGLHSLRNALTE